MSGRLLRAALSAALAAALAHWVVTPLAPAAGLAPDRGALEGAWAHAHAAHQEARRVFDAKYAEIDTFTDEVHYEWAARRPFWLELDDLKQELLQARAREEALERELRPLRTRARRVTVLAALVLWPLCYALLAGVGRLRPR